MVFVNANIWIRLPTYNYYGRSASYGQKYDQPISNFDNVFYPQISFLA